MRRQDSTAFYLPPMEAGVPLYFVGMGEEIRRSPDYRWHGLKREQQPRLLWQMTLRGEGTIEIGGNAPIPLRRGEGFLAEIPSDHCYYYRPGSPAWRFVWVIWSGPAFSSIADALMGKRSVSLMRMNPDAPEIRSLRAWIRTAGEVAGDPWRNSAEAYKLLLAVSRSTANQLKAPSKSGRTVECIGKLLRQKPNSTIGKDGLSEKMGLSRFQLYRALKQQAGISPHEWAARERTMHACQLLKTTQDSVAEIAVAVGLPDANYFARFFRHRTGYSPREWRRVFAR